MNDEVKVDTPNPIAQQIIESQMEPSVPSNINSPKGLFRVASPVVELKNRGIGYDKLSESQQQVLNNALSYQTSHRPDDLYHFLSKDDYLPTKDIQSGLKAGLQDICLNAPDEAQGGYPESWQTLLMSVRAQMPKLEKESRNDVAVSVIGQICDAKLNTKSGVAGEAKRSMKDIPFIVRTLVDQGDTDTLSTIKSTVENTVSVLKNGEGDDAKWNKDHGQWVEDNVLTKISKHMKAPEATPVV